MVLKTHTAPYQEYTTDDPIIPHNFGMRVSAARLWLESA
jgi:hypothetical protein